jgi:hypothetical protein
LPDLHIKLRYRPGDVLIFVRRFVSRGRRLESNFGSFYARHHARTCRECLFHPGGFAACLEGQTSPVVQEDCWRISPFLTLIKVLSQDLTGVLLAASWIYVGCDGRPCKVFDRN